MPVKTITEPLVECRDLDGQAIVYCSLNCEPYVIAKSIVKLLAETDYLCGENPYIQRIIEKLPEDMILLPVVGEELLSKVWDNPGDQKDVYFVKATALIGHLEEIFPDAKQALLQAVRQAMQGHIQSEKLKKGI
jgi:hypothetical protein